MLMSNPITENVFRAKGSEVWAFAVLLLCGGTFAGEPETKAKDAKQPRTESGREIFLREWIPNDPRSHGGDGLGPVFNDSSCVACHNLGGPGGGGQASKNVNIISATFNKPIERFVRPPRPGVALAILGAILGAKDRPRNSRELPKIERSEEELKKERRDLVHEVSEIHPGFRTAKSVVVHHFGTEKHYDYWRSRVLDLNGQVLGALVMARSATDENAAASDGPDSFDDQAEKEALKLELARLRMDGVRSRVQEQRFVAKAASQHGHFALSQSQRNPTALFGAGLIDAIPDQVLEDVAKAKYEGFAEVSGRVSRLPDGGIGRFGWKAQKATLRDFTVTACAVELGLHVPEHPQSGDPSNPDYKPVGFDLTKEECDALVEYLRNLPAPKMRKPAHPIEHQFLDEGKTLFGKVGCTTCHTENLGKVQGIYSDLLLHEMEPDLGDTGSYAVFVPNSPSGDDGHPVPPITELTKPIPKRARSAEHMTTESENQSKSIVGAMQLEWRTPPLWGVRDSGPYLHDGRATTLEEAIAMHGGEAERSAMIFFALEPEAQQKVVFFLKSLEAPRSE